VSRIIGVDPGISGALALLVDGVLEGVIDMPVFSGEASGRMIAIHLGLANPDVVVVEHVHPMPRNGGIASFSLGKNYGVVLGVAGSLSLPLVKIGPQEWKRLNGLRGKPKEASRGLAIQLWPDHAAKFARVKDDGRAEAALIARAHAMNTIQESNAQ
jgi:hypothetical protein